MQDARKYLLRFDEILNQMANEMLSQKIENNITKNFITCMIPHHQAAIYMCENLLQYTEYQPLTKIANEIIKTQTKGIEQMRQILETTKGYASAEQEVYWYMQKYFIITQTMIMKMRNSLRSNNINLNFTSEMIPHHEGAVQMCRNVLKYRIDPRLEAVAKNIIEEQSRGIKELKAIQASLA